MTDANPVNLRIEEKERLRRLREHFDRQDAEDVCAVLNADLSPYQMVLKRWGHEEVYLNQPPSRICPGGYCLKRLVVLAGMRSSLHMHPRKHETWIVQRGKLVYVLARRATPQTAGPGRRIVIEPGTWHWFGSRDGDCEILEISTWHEDADCERDPEELSGELDR